MVRAEFDMYIRSFHVSDEVIWGVDGIFDSGTGDDERVCSVGSREPATVSIKSLLIAIHFSRPSTFHHTDTRFPHSLSSLAFLTRFLHSFQVPQTLA